MGSFWDKLGRKAGRVGKWVTDPKQILTAAGFALGGPLGAGAGRAVGGMTPDPWGERESTLADGLQWGDVGQAGQDFASGYSVGKIGQQVPGIRGLEGAFGGAEAGQGLGVDALTMNNQASGIAQAPGQVNVSGVAPPPGGAQTQFDPTALPHELPGSGGGAPTQVAGGQVGMDPGTKSLMSTFQGMNPTGFASGRTADQFTAFNKLKVDAEKGGSFWGDMSGIEQIYMVNALASLGSAALSGEEKIPRAGVDMLGGMGMFSQAPQRQIPSFDEWRSQRGSYG